MSKTKKILKTIRLFLLVAAIICFVIFVIFGGIYHNFCKFTTQQTALLDGYDKYKANLVEYNKFLKQNATYNNYLKELKSYNDLADKTGVEPPNVVEKPAEVKEPQKVSLPANLRFKRFFGCEKDYEGKIDSLKEKLKNTLGLNEGFWDFFYPHLTIGALSGLWLLLITFIANKFSKNLNKNSWLNLISGSWWKIIPLAFVYAGLMEIPIVNTAIDFVVLSFLNDNLVIRSLMIIFYVGLIPSMSEEYRKYRIRARLAREVEIRVQERRYDREVHGR